MAPLTRRRKKALAAAGPPAPVIDPADRISKLPEEIQAQILSFLPAQEAVRTCVLARTWRHVWKFRRLLITAGRTACFALDRLLCVRSDGLKVACLDAAEIRFDPFAEVDDDDEEPDLTWEDHCRINYWINWVLECEIQILRVDMSARSDVNLYWRMSSRLLVSQHLTRLELKCVWFTCRCLDLDGCPGLEHLEINECCLEALRKITSLLLKCLVMTSCESHDARNRIQFCVPRLVSFLLDHSDIRTPLLERMPELVAAKVHIYSYEDCCHCDDPMACHHVTRTGDTSDTDDSDSDDNEEGSCDYAGQNTTKCVVLEGLAQAKDLELTAYQSTFILRRDLRWCPTFSKLKTLVLNHDYWCQPADCSELACILEHAPVLEKLKLIPYWVRSDRDKHKVEITGHLDATAKSNKISQHLKIVEISCEDVSEGILNVLDFLGALDIRFEIKVTKK